MAKVALGPVCPGIGSGLALIVNASLKILNQYFLSRHSWACQEGDWHILRWSIMMGLSYRKMRLSNKLI
jgi:hypothetical protein